MKLAFSASIVNCAPKYWALVSWSGNVAGLVALTAAFIGCRVMFPLSISEPIAFNDAMTFKDFCESKRLIFHSGNENGFVSDNYYVSDHPITLDDLQNFGSRSNCGLTAAWHGIIWVCQIDSPDRNTTLQPESIGGRRRVWGNVIVAGDEDLMDRIEELFRN